MVELWAKRRRDGFSRTLLGQGEGVNVAAIDAELKMQMRSGGPTCGAYCAQVVTLLNRLAFAHSNFAEVRVHRALAGVVLDYHHVAEAA